MALDERLQRELEGVARLADTSGVYEELIRRRERRRLFGRLQAGAVALAVTGAMVGGLVAVARRSPEPPARPATEPPTSVENGAIVFSLPLESGGEHLFSVNADGSGLRQLTHGDAIHRSPDVSPDGRTIAFSYSRGNVVALATMPVEGGDITSLTDEGTALDPAWSPDGATIAFAGSPTRTFPDGIYVASPSGGYSTLVPGTQRLDATHPAWSPDGSRLAFESTVDGRFDLFTVKVDGTQLTNLTNTVDADEMYAAWSAVTGRIAFVRTGDRSGLWHVGPEGTSERFVFSDLPAIAAPAWSPDGEAIAFAADTGQVYVIAATGGEPTPVTGALGDVAWQPLHADEPVVPAPSDPPSTGDDIGIGFAVCDVSSVRGEFESGVDGTAYVATKVSDEGECPELGSTPFQVLAVDVTGDGVADISYGPLECDGWCSAFAAPDVDGDGQDELLIQNVQFTIVGVKMYEVVGSRAIVPITIDVDSAHTPEFRATGFEEGEEPQFWIGGDAGLADAIRCVPFMDVVDMTPRAFVSVTSQYDIEGDETIEVTETHFVLHGSRLVFLSVSTYTMPTDDKKHAFLATGGCDAVLDPDA